MVALRIATYGKILKVRVDNPFYDNSKKGSQRELDYDIDLAPILANSNFISSKEDLILELENGQKVTMTPLRWKDSIRILTNELEEYAEVAPGEKEKVSRALKVFEISLLSMIKEVDGIDDREPIKEWLDVLPAGMMRGLTDKIDWIAALGPVLKSDVIDPVTNNQWEIALPLNPADFFAFGPSRVTTSAFLNILNN